MPVTTDATWCVYLLRSGNRTYIGSTTDPRRRLRQHNGEIVGGARATRGKTWQLMCWLEGFPNRSVACRWEKILKMRARGYPDRLSAMIMLRHGECIMHKKTARHYEPPENLLIMMPYGWPDPV